MYKRLLLLSLGWKTSDPYERGVQQALWVYQRMLFGSVFLLVCSLYVLGFVITRDIGYALYFLLIPLLLKVIYTVWLFRSALLELPIFIFLFLVFLVLGGGDIRAGLFGVIFVLIISIIFAVIISRYILPAICFDSKRLSYVENTFLSRNLLQMVRNKKIPTVKVHIDNSEATYSAKLETVLGVNYLCIHKKLYDEMSMYKIRGVLGHEIGHMVIPFGNRTFCLLEIMFLGFGNTLTSYFEQKANNKINQYNVPPVMISQVCTKKEFCILQTYQILTSVFSLISVYPASRKREYVADAFSAMLLRDVFPLICALSILERDLPFQCTDTHPNIPQRIEHLFAIELTSTHTRQ